jgi:hypothetical protein
MITTSFQTKNAEVRRLVRRYHQTIGGRSDRDHNVLCDLFAIAFRPGDRSGNFLNKAIRPLGTAVMTVLSYGRRADNPCHRLMPLRGFRAELGADGLVRYGHCGNALFFFNAAICPRARAFGVALNSFRNDSLIALMQQMDFVCGRQIQRKAFLPVIPHFPRVLLGFAPDRPPVYEETPALRQLAAEKLEMPVERLGSSGMVLLDRLLHDIWEQQFVEPGVAGNSTGCLLLDAELCTQSTGVLRLYEDFRHLLGVHVQNPVRFVTLARFPNPARNVLRDFQIDERSDFAERITEDQLTILELAMRQALGSAAGEFSTEEIYDAIVNPGEPITAWAKSCGELRSRLSPVVSECVTDDDLIRAARRPAEPLVASGACRIQVLQKRSTIEADPFVFDPDDLGRRVLANLWGSHPAQRHFVSDQLIAQDLA